MANGHEVLLPIGDKRDYDFVIEKDSVLKKVQVKYAGLYKKNTACKVGLRITGGNRKILTSKKYLDSSFDILFVYTAKGEIYVLPWDKVDERNELSIEAKKYIIYKQNA